MHYEKSCGALVLRRGEDEKWYILMIRHKHGGHRSFPKGHMERGETEYMTAVREVYEETSVQIRINTDFRETVHYSPLPGVSKEVVYFLTTTQQETIRPQEGEIAEVEWVPVEEAEASLTHENDKTVFRAAMKKLQDPSSVRGTAASTEEKTNDRPNWRRYPAPKGRPLKPRRRNRPNAGRGKPSAAGTHPTGSAPSGKKG
ncbi:MAG: NUDIX domain-containing protein [Clostridia bacterium]|nr:NUDIX domain-containing protein [Clostridia bacterium]